MLFIVVGFVSVVWVLMCVVVCVSLRFVCLFLCVLSFVVVCCVFVFVDNCMVGFACGGFVVFRCLLLCVVCCCLLVFIVVVCAFVYFPLSPKPWPGGMRASV